MNSICKREDEVAKRNENVVANENSEDEEELQLQNEDEGLPDNRKRKRNYDTNTKLEAIQWAQKNSVNSAASKFRVDRKCIREWMKREDKLKQQVNTAGGGKRTRLQGGGRHVHQPEIDRALATWINEMRENKRPVSRNIIRIKAIEMFAETGIKVSNGWLQLFLKRHNVVLHRRTTRDNLVSDIVGQNALPSSVHQQLGAGSSATSAPRRSQHGQSTSSGGGLMQHLQQQHQGHQQQRYSQQLAGLSGEMFLSGAQQQLQPKQSQRVSAAAASTSSSSALFLGPQLQQQDGIHLVQVNVKSEMPAEQQPAATHQHTDQDMLAMVEAQQWLAAHQQHGAEEIMNFDAGLQGDDDEEDEMQPDDAVLRGGGYGEGAGEGNSQMNGSSSNGRKRRRGNDDDEDGGDGGGSEDGIPDEDEEWVEVDRQIKRAKLRYFNSQAALAESQRQLVELQRKMAQKELNLKEREIKLKEREMVLKEKEMNMKEREMNLKERAASLKEKEMGLKEQKMNLDEQDMNLKKEEMSLRKKETTLKEKEANLQEQQIGLKEKKVKLKEKKTNFKEKEMGLREQEMELKGKEINLKAKKTCLKERQMALGDVQLVESQLHADLLRIKIEQMRPKPQQAYFYPVPGQSTVMASFGGGGGETFGGNENI